MARKTKAEVEAANAAYEKKLQQDRAQSNKLIKLSDQAFDNALRYRKEADALVCAGTRGEVRHVAEMCKDNSSTTHLRVEAAHVKESLESEVSRLKTALREKESYIEGVKAVLRSGAGGGGGGGGLRLPPWGW